MRGHEPATQQPPAQDRTAGFDGVDEVGDTRGVFRFAYPWIGAAKDRGPVFAVVVHWEGPLVLSTG